MAEKRIIRLSQNPAGFGEQTDELTQDMFDSALPTQHSHSYYEDEVLGISIGVWDTTDMIEIAAPYACEEFMTLIEGAVEIKNNKTGKVETIMAGESFVIPQNYDCQWHQQGYLKKFYVIYEPQHAPEKAACENVVYIDEKDALPWQTTSDGHRKKVLYQNQQKTFTAGVWQGKAFSTKAITFPYNEFIHITSGSLMCTDKEGVEHTFNVGDALFIPQGTQCAWQVDKMVTLSFAQISC